MGLLSLISSMNFMFVSDSKDKNENTELFHISFDRDFVVEKSQCMDMINYIIDLNQVPHPGVSMWI
jgi:hypothetical protein